MRIPSGTTDQVLFFVAVDSTDFTTRETGLSSFTVYRSRNGGTATAMTTPTVTELDATNMPGVYKLLLDEDMTIDAGDDSQEMCFHITQASMAPVTRTIELYRPKITVGETLTVGSGIGYADIQSIMSDGTASGNLWDDYDGTGYNKANSTIGAVGNSVSVASVDASAITSTSFAAGAITASAIAADAIGASELAADAVTEIQSGLATAAALATAQADLDTITGTDGVTLATAQALYAPAKAGDNMGTVSSVTGNVGGNVVGSVASVTGAVGSVTGNVGGNVVGSVASVTGGINTGAGVITTLDGLDTAQDTQHSTTQTYLTNNLGTAGAAATEAGGTGDHLTALAQADTMEGFFQITLRSDAAIATDRAAILTLINANEGTGAGDYSITTDSQEGQRDTLPAAVEAAILDEGDATALLAAIAAKVEEFLINDGDASATLAAIATAVWGNGTRTLTANTNLNDPTAAAIADAVWDEAKSGHVVAGSFGKSLADVEADTNELQSNQGDWATAVGFSTHSAADVADAVFDEATAGHVTAGTFGKLLADVLADTNELQADDVPALIAALNDLDAAGIRTAIGLATANLDTQLGKADLTAALTEAYRSTGATGSAAELLYEILAHLGEFAISGTTKTAKKLDGSTTAKTYTLDDATNPTSITEAT